MHLQAGALLKNGEYKIEKVLGQGGFGITYLAEQISLGRKVALKEFFMEGLCNRDAATSHVSVPSVGSKKLVERFKQKFIKEARNIASLEHKHIVPIIDVFEENGTAYYVMKYFSGGSLSFNSAIPEDVALRYTNQLASALCFIHQKRMMHLDIKPSNILLDDEGNVVLIDFGLAKQYDNAGRQTSTTPVGISHGYAPIEQYRSGGVSAFSPATDIYSLGATLYKLLTGTVPPEAMDLVATGVPACPANVSAETWKAVKSAMQPAASSRPQSVDEFLSLLSENGKVKTENGKNKEENDGETELNGNVKAASKREGENLFTHTASESSFDEVKVENGKLVADEFHSIDVVDVPDSASPVISNESEKSQENKLILLLLLLVAVAGAWFLFGGTGSGDAPKKDTINDSLIGKTPIKNHEIPQGAHNIKITKDGYKDYNEKIEASAGPCVINETLEEKPKPVASLTTDKHNGHEYVDLGLPSGLKWATCNVGASSPSDYGDYYAWGEISTKSSYDKNNSTTYGKEIGDIAGDPTYDVARAKWRGSWRLPTMAEFDELLDSDNCTWKWTTQDGHKGYKVTSKKNGNSIFLPAAGWRDGTSSYDQGSYGRYWSATPDESYTYNAHRLYFFEGFLNTYCGSRDSGRSVRPVFQNN